jgi:hypothetical protein
MILYIDILELICWFRMTKTPVHNKINVRYLVLTDEELEVRRPEPHTTISAVWIVLDVTITL